MRWGGLRIGDDVRFYHCGRYSKIWSAGNQSGNHGRNWWHPAADAVGGADELALPRQEGGGVDIGREREVGKHPVTYARTYPHQ